LPYPAGAETDTSVAVDAASRSRSARRTTLPARTGGGRVLAWTRIAGMPGRCGVRGRARVAAAIDPSSRAAAVLVRGVISTTARSPFPRRHAGRRDAPTQPLSMASWPSKTRGRPVTRASTDAGWRPHYCLLHSPCLASVCGHPESKGLPVVISLLARIKPAHAGPQNRATSLGSALVESPNGCAPSVPSRESDDVAQPWPY